MNLFIKVSFCQGSVPKKRRGLPTYNADYVLNPRQKKIILAMLLTDGSIHLQQTKSKNPHISFQNSRAHEELVQYLFDLLKPLIRAESPTSVMKGSPANREQRFESLKFNTVSHPQFNQFIDALGGHGRNKTIPTVSYLVENMDWESFAVMIMCDGSIVGRFNRGMRIHLQNFSYKAQVRLCIALYYRFGIKCIVRRTGVSKSGNILYNIQTSSYSLRMIQDKMLPYMLETFRYKVPDLEPIRTTNHGRAAERHIRGWVNWYREHKNDPWLETLEN
jgi:hypothetical protein